MTKQPEQPFHGAGQIVLGRQGCNYSSPSSPELPRG